MHSTVNSLTTIHAHIHYVLHIHSSCFAIEPRYLGCLSTSDGPSSEEEEDEEEEEAEEEEEEEEEEESANDLTLSDGGPQLLQQVKELSGRIRAGLSMARYITTSNNVSLCV